MLNTRVKVNLVRQFRVLEDFLGLVALLGREDLVSLGGGDGEGTGDGGEFRFFDEGGVGDVADVDAFALGHVADDVFGTKAVADGAEVLDALLFAEVFDGLLDDAGRVSAGVPKSSCHFSGQFEIDSFAEAGVWVKHTGQRVARCEGVCRRFPE